MSKEDSLTIEEDNEEEKEFRHYLKSKEPKIIIKNETYPNPSYENINKYIDDLGKFVKKIINKGGSEIKIDSSIHCEYGEENVLIEIIYNIIETKDEFRSRCRKEFYDMKKRKEDDLKKLAELQKKYPDGGKSK